MPHVSSSASTAPVIKQKGDGGEPHVFVAVGNRFSAMLSSAGSQREGRPLSL